MMKKIIQTVQDGGGELGVHMYPFVSKEVVIEEEKKGCSWGGKKRGESTGK